MIKFGIMASACLLSFSASAEVHKWTDQQGNIHYTSTDVLASQYDSHPVLSQSNSIEDAAQTPINCNMAVFNTKDSIDAMMLVGLQNFKDGYIEEDEYNDKEVVLSRIKQQVSMSECKSAEGETAEFYRCMADESHHVLDCGRQYSYGY